MNATKMVFEGLLLSSAIGLFLLSPVHLSPIVVPIVYVPSLRPDFCYLTPKFGTSGIIKFVEECQNLDIFPTLPMPGPAKQKYGIHPMVCCPKVSKKFICFPTDEWCPVYVKQTTPVPQEEDLNEEALKDVGEDYEIVTDRPTFVVAIPKVSDDDCSAYVPYWGNGTRCVNLKDCPALFGPPLTPTSFQLVPFCGWDIEDKVAKVCCPGTSIQDSNKRVEVPPLFPGYKCHDKVDKCQKWKDNQGCRTDMDFVMDPDDPNNGRAISRTMFDFMTGTCMETCEFCGDKGCRDEHPDCPDWARQGYCVIKADFMVHTCRESCGVCGFLSTDDTTVQVVGEDTYSDFRDPHFDCGRFKLLAEINEENAEEVDDVRSQDDYVQSTERKKRQDSAEEKIDVFVSNDSPDKFCAATVITDKWLLTAAHCYDDLGSTLGTVRKVKIDTIRVNTDFKEVIEIKRVFKHPKYQYPTLYNDIALLELGRRIEYNWEKFGDSPVCIDREGQNENKTATIEGHGTTEDGTLATVILGANVTVISNDHCKSILASKVTDDESIQAKKSFKSAFPNGLKKQMFCALGKEKSPGVIRGACPGDSGGPLHVRRDDGRRMLVGIVSGGPGCGQGFPGWYTKVSYFVPWIECIIEGSVKYKNNKEKIEQECEKVAEQAEEDSPDDDIFAGDLSGLDEYEDNSIFNEYDDDEGEMG